MPTPEQSKHLPHVKAVRRGDRVWLYYRRGGRQWPLPGPEGSTAFLAEYHRIHASYGRLKGETPPGSPGTVDAAITLYLRSADYQGLRPRSRADYRRTLDAFRGAFGPLHLADLGVAWWDALRDKHASAPVAWNNLRSRMKDVVALYRRRHPELVPSNPLLEVTRLPIAQSDQNRAWPAEVLRQVMERATPAFRALLTAYLLTAQRGGDVTAWRWDQYDQAQRTITMRQRKTGKPLPMPVSDALAAVIETQRGRHPERIFASPRGRAWTLGNAQETLARLLGDLGVARYTLHGLRATGPTALKGRGMENRRIRELTGHDSDRNLEIYLRGAGGLDLRREATDLLEDIFGALVASADQTGNPRRFAGVTGRAARKSRAELATELETGNSPPGNPEKT
jgi:integrase